LWDDFAENCKQCGPVVFITTVLTRIKHSAVNVKFNCPLQHPRSCDLLQRWSCGCRPRERERERQRLMDGTKTGHTHIL